MFSDNCIINFKRQMQSMGINVVVDLKGKVLNGNRAAGFDYATGTIYIKKKAGVSDGTLWEAQTAR